MTLFSLTEVEYYITDIVAIRKRNKMKTVEEINNEIKALQRKMNQLFSKKRQTHPLSVSMGSVDNEIEKIGSRIRALQWVINYEE